MTTETEAETEAETWPIDGPERPYEMNLAEADDPDEYENLGVDPLDDEWRPYLFTTLVYTHPEPKYRATGIVSIEFYDGYGILRVSGGSIHVE